MIEIKATPSGLPRIVTRRREWARNSAAVTQKNGAPETIEDGLETRTNDGE
jgi:hypothetical protein